MKKIIVLLLCMISVLTLFTACKKDETEDKESKDKSYDINVEKLADKLLEDIKFVDELTTKETDFVVQWFFMNADDVEEQKTYMGSGSTAELISVVKCKDEDAAKDVEKVFKDYAAERSKMYADYAPEECVKLDNPVIKVYGQYVVVCISDDNDTAKKTIEGQVE